MIVYGTRGRLLPGPMKQDAACHRCGHSPLNTAGVVRYFHVFWIPVLPFLRQEVMECPSCKAARMGKEVPEPARTQIRRAVFTGRRMAPMFAGAVLALAFVGLGAYSGAQKSRLDTELIARPAVSDHYVVSLPDVFPGADKTYPYGVLEVSAVDEGRVILKVPRYAYERSLGAERAVSSGAIRKADYFAAETVEVDLAELRRMREQNAIRSVLR